MSAKKIQSPWLKCKRKIALIFKNGWLQYQQTCFLLWLLSDIYILRFATIIHGRSVTWKKKWYH